MTNPYAPPGMDDGYLPPGGSSGGGPLPWEIGEVLKLGWEIVKRQPILFLAAFIATVLPNLPGSVDEVFEYVGLWQADSLPAILVAVSTGLFGMAASWFLQVGLLRMFLAAARGQQASLGMLLSGADRFLPMVGYSILVFTAIGVGLVLLIVPGVIIAIGLWLGQFYLVDQRQGVIQSIQSSWQATQGNRLDLFLFALAHALLMLLGLCACLVGIFVAVPVLTAALTLVYLRRSGQLSWSPDLAPPPGPAPGYSPYRMP